MCGRLTSGPNHFVLAACLPTERAMQLPQSRPARREVISGDRYGIEKRFSSAGEPVEVRRPDGLKGLLEEEIVVRRKYFDGMVPRYACDPVDEVVVSASLRRKRTFTIFPISVQISSPMVLKPSP